MAEVIRMPRLSDTMEEGNIVAWLKKVGDKVSPGDILAEVETDKATMELESFHEGYLLYISVPKGPVPVNEILAVIGDKDEDYKPLIEGGSGGDGEAEPKEEAPNEKEATSKKEADKPTQEKAPEKKEGKSEKPGKKELEQESPETEQDKETAPSENKDPEASEQPSGERIKSSPLAKSIAAKAGVDISGIKGSGDGGRIIKRDVEKLVASGNQSKVGAQMEPSSSEEVPLTMMRKTIAKRLVESKFSAPHFYLTMKINMDKVADARKLINDQTGMKISFNDFIIKACAAALKQHPAINSSWLGDKIKINKDINIGVAVAVDEGLLVPVLFNAPDMTLSVISEQVNSLAEKARQKKLQPQEMQGNTFTVSNLGMFGIDEFTAIINPPDSAIMAIGAIADELKLVDGQVRAEKIMKITLSCDHRVIDGATGSKFLQTFRQLLENPVAMLV